MKRVSENQVGDGGGEATRISTVTMDYPNYYYSRPGYRSEFANARGYDRVPSSFRILTDYLSPGSKVKDFYPPHPNPGFPQETPMKPSQIPNTQPPRSHLPIHCPDWLYRPPRHPPWPPGNRHLPNHPNDGSVWNGENYPIQRRCRSNSTHETFYRRPVSPTRRQNPQGSRYQDTNGHATHWPNERDQQERAAVGPQKNDRTGQDSNKGNTPLLSGSESETAPLQRPESFRPSSTLEQAPVQDQGGGASFPSADSSTSKPGESSLVVQMSVMKLYKPCEQPLLSRSDRGTGPLQRSKSWSPSSTLEQAPVKDQGRRVSFPPADSSTLTQNQPDHPTLSNETSQKKDSCHLVLKRRRESGSDDDNAKKQCLKPTGPDVMLQCPTANVVSPDSCSQKLLCGLELSPETSNNHSRTESTHPNGINRSPSPPRRLKSCLKQIPMGAKQACIKSMQNNVVILESPSKRSEVLAKTEEESQSKTTHKNVSFTLPNMPNDPKSPSRSHMARDANTVDSMSQKTVTKQSTNPSSCRKLRRNKKPVVADDLQDLFTPDPTTYIVNLGQKTLKTRPDDKPKALKSDKNGSSTSVSSNPQTPGLKLCQNEKTATMSSQASNAIVKIPVDMKISLPRVILTRIPVPTTNTISVAKPEHVGKDVATPGRTSVSPSRTDGQIEKKSHEDSLDLDLELSFDSDLEVISTHSSSDSEDVKLVSLHEIMTKTDKPEKGKPERGAFSQSSSPGNGQHSGHHHTMSSTKTGNCKNRLDQLLKEFTESKRARETEMELLATCQEDLLKIAEYEEAESKEEPISDEQQQFLQRFSLASSAIRDVPPGHEVFNLETFGRLFNQNTLQLRQCTVTPQNRAQKTLLWSSHSQFRLNVTIDVFQAAYNNSPCPFQITRFLFKMLSVHSDQILSDKILRALNDIAVTAAVQRVNGENEEFKVWVPSLADLTLVLMNMGAPFVSLFPLESLQPPFTERDLLEDIYVKSESPSKEEPRRFPEHNFTNIYKYLSLCLRLCPRFYSDRELLLLLTLLCTVRLESRLLLQSRVPFYPLLYRLLKNIRRWDDMMPKMCQSLTDLTEDHHNMCHLIKLLPHHRRGLNLRQHLSVAMISKLLDGSCSYTPRSKELQLSDLTYLPRMKPLSLLRIVTVSSQRSHAEGEDDQMLLDQQTYYLLYSLLTLVNEATNFQRFPAHQKEQLLLLCSELERHVKCHIREGEKWLYRSKVKDLVARIYTKWQMTLQKTRPLNGKLYDYWQPLQSDVGSSQDVEEIESSQDAAKKADVSDSEEEAGARTEDAEEEEVIEIEVPRNEGEETASTAEWTGPSHAAEELDTKGTEVGEKAPKSTFDMETEGGSPSMPGLSPGPSGPSTSKAV